LLPVLVEGEQLGALVFYILWQAAYAATIPATLPDPAAEQPGA
jgi:hypothetical protein